MTGMVRLKSIVVYYEARLSLRLQTNNTVGPFMACLGTNVNLSLHFLIRSYQDWAQNRVDKLDAMLPEMLQRIALFSNKSGYLRRSEHHELHQFLNDGLKDSELNPELAATFRPRSFEKISPWLGEHQAWVEEHNQQWLTQQSQKWSSWF